MLESFLALFSHWKTSQLYEGGSLNVALATPRVAAQITWSQVVNTRGLAGHNIPVDLKNEH